MNLHVYLVLIIYLIVDREPSLQMPITEKLGPLFDTDIELLALY